MSLKNNNIDFELIWREINSTLSGDEKQIFENWLNSDSKHSEYFEKVKFFYQSGKVHDAKILEIVRAWGSTDHKLGEIKKSRNLPDWIKIVTSVAATVIIMLSVYFLVDTNPEPSSFAGTTIKIPPGTSKARLVFDDGQSVDLSEGKTFKTEIEGTIITNQGNQIAYSGKKVDKLKTARYNTLEIPRGAEYFIILSDSTKVWLNSESKLRYPVVFAGDERNVELTGEAYFEVAKDKTRPFKVFAENQVAEVTGTEFNLTAYPDDKLIFTTLVEGKVRVFLKDKPELVQTLIPGYQTYCYKESGDISIRQVNVNEYIAWKSGIFSFKDKPLEEMMLTLSRWYDINIVFEDQSKKNIRFTGEVQRYENFEKILTLIEKTYEVKFKLTGNEIVVR